MHKALDGFDIQLNEFGEVTSNLNMDKLNEFLNERVDDKKLRDREGANSTDSEPVEEESTDSAEIESEDVDE